MAQNIQQLNRESAPQETYRRFGPGERFEHIVLIVTFTGLSLTGLPQRYAGADWAQWMIAAMGGIESIRIVHRILATILMAETIYHGGIVSYKLFVLGRQASMLPGFKDARDVFEWIAFNLGLRKKHPTMPRYNFGEKVEYLAVIWGTLVMIITGFMLWNPIATTNFLPGEVVPAARAAHSGEAFLAVLSIVLWHMYNVHVKRFNRSMFTGKITHEEMEEEHAGELEQILRGETTPLPEDETIRKRMRVFVPYAIVTSIVLTLGLVWFVTFEDTAIETVDPIPVDPAAALTVSADVGVPDEGQTVWSTQACATCHGAEALGTPGTLNIGIANTPLDFEQFAEKVRRGPADMPAYSIRDISDEELAHLYAWLQSLEAAPTREQ